MRIARDVQFETVRIGPDMAYLLHWQEANAYFSRELALRIKENIKEVLMFSGYSAPTIDRWLRSVVVEYAPGYVAVKLRDRILNFLEFGTRASKPRGESRKSIPIRLPGGQVIFRRITYKSLMLGRWRRPARPGRFMIRGAILSAVQEFAAYSETNIPVLIARIAEIIRRGQKT